MFHKIDKKPTVDDLTVSGKNLMLRTEDLFQKSDTCEMLHKFENSLGKSQKI